MHNKQVQQFHTCLGKEKQDLMHSTKKKNAYTKPMYTSFEMFLGILPKNENWRGEKKLNIEKKNGMPCEEILSRRTEVQQNTLMSKEHKAYIYLSTYTEIYTLKYKNACIVYYFAVF